MYKYNPFIMQNIRANTLIIKGTTIPLTKVRLNADFSINYKNSIICSFIENNYVCIGKFLHIMK